MTQVMIVTCDACGASTQAGSDWNSILWDVGVSGPRIPRLQYRADLCPQCVAVFVDKFTDSMSHLVREIGREREIA